MYSTKKRFTGVVAILLGLALVGAACGDDSGGTDGRRHDTVHGRRTGGVTTTKPAEVTGTLNGSGRHLPQGVLRRDDRRLQEGPAEGHRELRRRRLGQGSHRPAGRRRRLRRLRRPRRRRPTCPSTRARSSTSRRCTAPITVSYNLAGVDKLQLSPETIAKIFQRDIKTWDDPAIVAENTGDQGQAQGQHRRRPPLRWLGHHRELHHLPRQVGRRRWPGVWKLKSGSTVEWPADTQAGSGNAGVAQIVKSTAGRDRLHRLVRCQSVGPQVRLDQEQGGQVRRSRRSRPPRPRSKARRSMPTSATTRCGPTATRPTRSRHRRGSSSTSIRPTRPRARPSRPSCATCSPMARRLPPSIDYAPLLGVIGREGAGATRQDQAASSSVQSDGRRQGDAVRRRLSFAENTEHR